MNTWWDKAKIDLQHQPSILCGDSIYRVRRYPNRIAICRNDGIRMTWEELQAVKQKILGDVICIEVFPKQSEVVNLRHTRHLWFDPRVTEVVDAVCNHPEFS